MSDLLEITEDRVTLKVNGTDHAFELLSVRDKAELLRADRKARRDQLKADLADAGVSGEQAFIELRSFDDAENTEAAWIRFVNAPENDYEILRRSLLYTLEPAEAERVAGRCKPSLAFKARLCGLSVTVPEETPDPNREIPATYGKPGASTTPTPSES